MKPIPLSFALLATTTFLPAEPAGFPFKLPETKRDRPLSLAMQRLYDDYLEPSPEDNDLYSTFKFTPLEGLYYQSFMEGLAAFLTRNP